MNRLELVGRLIPMKTKEIEQLNYDNLTVQPAITVNRASIHCTRCDEDCEKYEASLPDQTYF